MSESSVMTKSPITIEEIPDEDTSQSLNSLGLDEFKGLLFVPADPQELGSFMKDLVAEQQHFLDGLRKDYPGLSEDLYTDKDGISWNTSSSSHEADPNVTDWIFDMSQANPEDKPDLSDQSESDDDEFPDMDTEGFDKEETYMYDYSWEAHKPPTTQEARDAVKDLNHILRPPHLKGRGYKECTVPLIIQTCFEWMRDFLHLYQDNYSPF